MRAVAVKRKDGPHAGDTKNRIRQVGALGSTLEGSVASFSRGRLTGHVFQANDGSEPILVVPRSKTLPDSHERVIAGTLDPTAATEDLSRAPWLKHPLLQKGDALAEVEKNIAAVLQSWEDSFSFSHEDAASLRIGLRPPQVGAVHAVHAHWTVSNDPATIVMPTGTGKTETMLSILVSTPCSRVLVVVPTDALRTQLTDKFLSLGMLKAPGSRVLKTSAMFPLVCMLEHAPRTVEEVDTILGAAQVVIMTS